MTAKIRSERLRENYKFVCVFLSTAMIVALGLANGLYLAYLYNLNPIAFWVADVTQFVVLPAIVLCLLYKAYGIIPKDYGLAGSNKIYPAWEMVGAGIFSALLLLTIPSFFWYLGISIFGTGDHKFLFESVVPEGILHLPVVLYLSLTAGFVEEVFYRGLLWTAFLKIGPVKFRKSLYVILGSFVFAALHWEQGVAGTISAFVFGVLAAILYLQLRNLWPMIAAHTLVDIYYFW